MDLRALGRILEAKTLLVGRAIPTIEFKIEYQLILLCLGLDRT
jgi:hypothetical protein